VAGTVRSLLRELSIFCNCFGSRAKAENADNKNSQACFGCQLGEIEIMRMFKVTACVPSQTRIRTQRELQNTFFTKLVPYDSWFREQQRIQKMGGKIVKVELATGKPGRNTGLA
jgi:phycobilisome core linker protein